jgi:hypothetical protein
MTRFLILLISAILAFSPAAAQPAASLRGTVTDPSDAVVPGALVQLRGAGGEQRAYTNEMGEYEFPRLFPGKYRVRVIAKGFTVFDARDFDVSGAVRLDVALTIQAEAQVVNVEAEAARVSIEPDSAASAVLLGEKELAALSDDPDELAQQLQALAGPAAGPNGGQIYIDGFSGGNLPPKSSIREVRINSNPYSTEYDRPGFGRIEIFTRPGSDALRGQAFFMYNNESLNSRSPLYEQSQLPPFLARFFGFSLTGPVKKNKASFGLDFERRSIKENAFIYATTLDANLNPVTVNTALVTPQTRTNFSPRLDLSLSPNHTLVARYQQGVTSNENEGVGGFSLAERAFNATSKDRSVQVTETAVLGARAVNESRLQWMRMEQWNEALSNEPALIVQGAFESGGAQVGRSGAASTRLEWSNTTTMTHGTHTWKFGARLRWSQIEDTSVNNFGGTYTFFGGAGPALDANLNPVAGALVQLTALERYRRTLLLGQLGYSAAMIRALGGGASQFSLAAGTPLTAVSQTDAGLFFNDDWRLRRNLTLSYGIRYETQSNISDYGNWAPRFGLAWGLGRGNNIKTVVRLGAGVFYDRVGETLTLQALRFNGLTQQSYLLINPDTFPLIPNASLLAAYQQPQRLQFLDAGVRAPRSYQASLGVERQVNQYVRLSAQYIANRSVHLLRSRNINAPVNGAYPFGDAQVRLLNESTGNSRSHTFVIGPNVSYKKLFLFGFYSLGFGKTDAEGIPADPYNLHAEWGPSSWADVRHRAMIGTNLPMPWKITLNPFLMLTSGMPYNITTGRDLNGDTFTAERPSLLTGVNPAACAGADLVYAPQFGCFNLNPAPGTEITRNFARGPANITLNLRLARTWGFGSKGEAATDEPRPPAGGPPPGGGPGAGGPPPGGGSAMGGGRGPGGPGGVFGGSSTGKRFNLTLSAMVRNLLNSSNFAPPSGDLSSPFFGEYRSLAGFGPMGGASTYNRRIDLQLRLAF